MNMPHRRSAPAAATSTTGRLAEPNGAETAASRLDSGAHTDAISTLTTPTVRNAPPAHRRQQARPTKPPKHNVAGQALMQRLQHLHADEATQSQTPRHNGVGTPRPHTLRKQTRPSKEGPADAQRGSTQRPPRGHGPHVRTSTWHTTPMLAWDAREMSCQKQTHARHVHGSGLATRTTAGHHALLVARPWSPLRRRT